MLLALVLSPLVLAAEPAIAATSAPAGATPPTAVRAADEHARLALLYERVAASHDSARGGFVDRTGAPSEAAIELALALAGEADGAPWRDRALGTLAWTRGLMDTMSGGFIHRRARHGAEGAAFDRRTDINGRRLALLLAAWRTTGDERFRRDAGRVAGFMDRVLLDGRGGFVTAQVGDRTLQPQANGVAIHAWLAWAAANRDPAARDFAVRSIERVWETSFDSLGVLLRRGAFGEVLEWPRLGDQVEMGRALLSSAHLCGRPQDLARARGLGRVMIAKFEDGTRGGFMTEARPRQDGTIRRAGRDPGENARAALFLAELAAATGDGEFLEAARRALAAFEVTFAKAGPVAAEWALAQRAIIDPGRVEAPEWRAAAATAPPQPRIVRFRQPRTGR